MRLPGCVHLTAGRDILRVIATLCACAAAACGSTTVSDVSAPSSARCGSSVAGLPGTVGAGGGRFAATIAIARECTWAAESDSAWLQISPASGQGETAVSVVVAENPDSVSRTAALTVNGAKTSVRQEAATCQFTWKASSLDVPASGGTVTIGVSTTAGCAWQASTSATWLRGTRTGGTGEGSAQFVAAANEGTKRTATVRVGDASMTVTQAGADEPDPSTPPPLTATYVGAASGTHNFDVSGPLSLAPGTYRITFNRAGSVVVRGVAGGGGGGGGARRDNGGSALYAGAGGGGGAANLTGASVPVVAGTTYEAVVGAGGSGGAGATERSGNIATAGDTGGSTYFRVPGGTVFLHLNGGAGGAAGSTSASGGGAGGTVAAGSGVSGGDGGAGGGFRAAGSAGSGIAGSTTGGGGGGGGSRDGEDNTGGGPGGQGGASGAAGGGEGAAGGSDSGIGGSGGFDLNGADSPGGGGGGGKGLTVPSGPSNRGGGAGGGGAANTTNSSDHGGNGGAGGNGGMSIGIR